MLEADTTVHHVAARRHAAADQEGDAAPARIEAMIRLAWAPSPALRDWARAGLAASGVTVADDPVCLDADA